MKAVISFYFSKGDACKPNNRAKNTMKMMNKILETSKEREHIENKDDLISFLLGSESDCSANESYLTT